MLVRRSGEESDGAHPRRLHPPSPNSRGDADEEGLGYGTLGSSLVLGGTLVLLIFYEYEREMVRLRRERPTLPAA